MSESKVQQWLDKTINEPGVVGAILVDSASGLSLGARGVAENDDAPFLKWFYTKQLASETAGLAEYRNHYVYLQMLDNALVGIYKRIHTTPEPTDE